MVITKSPTKITSAVNSEISVENSSQNLSPSGLALLIETACTPRYIAFFIAACAVMKFIAAACFPFIGDEAYATLWGKYPAWGYYDHPPVLGWLIHLTMYIGSSPLVLRLLPIIFSVLVAAGVYAIVSPYDKIKACFASAFFAICPFSMAFIFVTTDVALLLFSFISVFFLFKAETSRSYPYYLFSGIFLGLAFLSKYFAVLLGASYLVYFLSVRKNGSRIIGLVLLTLGALPFIAQNILWNYDNGWPNIMHNWYNRVSSAQHNPLINLLILIGLAAYAFTPPALYLVYKNRKRIFDELRPAQFRLLALAWLIPMGLFVLISIIKTVRPHWLLFLLPFASIMIALLLNKKHLLDIMQFAVIFSVIQTFFVCVIPFVPIAAFKNIVNDKDLATLTLHLHPQKVISSLQEYKNDYVFATESFSTSALLEFSSNSRVIVIGKGSNHGRHDDILTDFKKLDGKNILILQRKPSDLEKFDDCFASVSTRQFDIGIAKFYLYLGRGFKYQSYRDKFLTSIAKKYYKIPDWLPRSQNGFHSKYDF